MFTQYIKENNTLPTVEMLANVEVVDNEKTIGEFTNMFTVYIVETLGAFYLKTWDFDSQDFYYRQLNEDKNIFEQIDEMLI